MADGGSGTGTGGATASAERVLVVANAGAGSAQRRAVADVVRALEAEAEVELVRTEGLGPLAAALAAVGGRRLVLVGGDGSIHHAVAALHAEEALREVGPIGVVPLGTGNDLARSLGLPLDPVQAAQVALRGRPRDVELLVDELARVVVNTVHAGIGADAAARATRMKRVLGRAAYPVGAALAGARREEGWRLRVAVDGEELADGREPVLMVGIGLGGTIGGGSPLLPDADPHDGVADVVVAAPVGARERLAFARHLREGVHVERHDVRTAQGRLVEVVSTDGRTFRTNADGELGGPWTHKRWRTVEAAWQVVVPR